MTENPTSPLRHLGVRIGLVVFVCFILILTGAMIYMPGNDPTPTVYHREDGTFSLNRRDGPAITPDDLFKCLIEYESFGSVKLVCNSKSRIEDWYGMLNRGGESGAGSFQFEYNGMVFDFVVPLSDGHTYRPLDAHSTIINLSDISDPDLAELPGSDVVILVVSSTICGDLVNSTLAFKGQNKSIVAVTARERPGSPGLRVSEDLGVFFDHRRNNPATPSFKRRHSAFWNRHVRPFLGPLKSMF